MRTKCCQFALWAGAGLMLALAVQAGRAQTGPDGDGAVLRLPGGEDPRPRVVPQTGSPSVDTSSSATADLILAKLTVDPRYEMNRDIAPTPPIGPWMICVHSYITKEAPEWARQMTGELRSTYNLPAYVFTFGIEERRREYERVKGTLDQQRKAMKERGLEFIYMARGNDKSDTPYAMISNDLPLQAAMRTLKVQHIPVQCGVLVGGYANEEVANKALLKIKKLPQPDPKKVQLDIKYYGADSDPMNQSFVKLKKDSGAAEFVNPFHKAFVCRNPSVKQDRAGDPDAMDMKLLRKLNSDEPYSLLNCKKPMTLAIKQFQTFLAVQDREQRGGIMQNFGFNTIAGSKGVDQAAHDAHALAELLRKNKNLQLDTYVLHTKFTSVVTVGGYDSVDDPNLIAMQRQLGNKLREWERMAFFQQPMPMKVPR